MTKPALVVLTIVGTAVVAVSSWKLAFHRNSSHVADALRRAGYKADSAGRFLFKDRSFGGITPAYDPNLKNPATGFRRCNARIDACMGRTASIDDCVREAPRCVSKTPWKNDPAGDDCCPESCVREYFANRKTQTPEVAITNLVDGMCYPGLLAFVSGSDGGTP